MKDLRIITDRDEGRRYFDVYQQSVTSGGVPSSKLVVHPGRQTDLEVYWHQRLGMWPHLSADRCAVIAIADAEMRGVSADLVHVNRRQFGCTKGCAALRNDVRRLHYKSLRYAKLQEA